MVINKKKNRLTSQRLKILDYLRGVKTHPTAEMVYNAVKKDLPTISLATVYRNLNLLAEQGEIIKLELNSESHFDGDMCNHQHCVCSKCRRIIDIFQEDISEYAMKKIKSSDFKPSCVNIIFKGHCKHC